MDTSDPEIIFDNKGICNHCRDFKKRLDRLPSKEILQKEIEKIKIKAKDKKYDCIIGLSGGVDSSMVAYLVVKKYGLRPLAVHLDNGWDSEAAVRNIENIVKILNINFYTHVINWEEFKDLQISFLKASVANIEVPTDHAIVASLYNIAAKVGVEYIIQGGNLNSEGIMPSIWGYDARDLKNLKAIHKKFGKMKLKTFPTLGIWRLVYYSLIKKIKYFPILNYIDYKKTEAKEILKKELGWQDYGEKHGESLFTKFFQDYILPEKFGIDKRKAHYSTLINSGQITRKEAIDTIKNSPFLTEKDMLEEKEYVLKKLCLSEKKFQEIMSQPVKSYKDYPNHSLFLHELSFIYRLIKKIIT